jgi:hypothetical protein
MAQSNTNTFVEQDPPLPNQKYSLFSFVPPKDNLEKVFGISRYEKIKELLETKKDELLKQVDENPEFFVAHILTALTPALVEAEKEEALKSHKLRGAVKFRGSFATLEDAKKYSENLRNLDPNYDIFLGQTGFWYPFDPARENVKEQNYYGDQLNDLMKGYMENKTKADIHFKQRMREMAQKKIEDDLKAAEAEEPTGKDEDIIDELDDPTVAEKQ